MSEFSLQGRGVFGRYCRIEMHRYVGPNEFYIHKCIGQYKSLQYCDVPLKVKHEVVKHKPRAGKFPDNLEDVILVVQCGIEEADVFPVALKDVELLGEDFNDEWKAIAEARGQTIDRQASEIAKLRELVDLCYTWLVTNCEKGYIIPRVGLDDIERSMRELGIEVGA